MTEPKQRPQFLTVICILSFIGLGWAMLNALISMALAPIINKMGMTMGEALDEVPSDAEGLLPMLQRVLGGSKAVMEHAFELSMINLICSTIALFGVIQMWKLKKNGFYFFTGAKVIIIVAPMILIGGSFGLLYLILAIFPIAFIAMYAANLKAME